MSPRRPKARRRIRATTRPVVALTARDEELLLLIGLCRYLSLTQVAREFFPSEDRARRRIRQLFDAGLIAITLTSSTAPNLVSLTRLGLLAVIERVPQALGDRLHLPGPIRLAGVRHRLAVVDARIFAAHWGIACGTPLTRWSNAGGELIRQCRLDRLHLSPDGIAEYGGGRCIGVEIDCSTEALGVLKMKLRKYHEAAAGQMLTGLWLVVIGRKERRAHVQTLVEEAGLSNWALVLTHEQLLARPIVDPYHLEVSG